MNNGLMLVSVIIPYYNNIDFLKEALNSLENQNYKNIEIIIIDDGSEVLLQKGQLQNFQVNIFRQDNAGPSVAKKLGVSKSSGEILFFLDSDNCVTEKYISKAVKIFKEQEKIDVVYSDYEYFGDKKGIGISGEINVKTILLFNSIDNCVLIRKKCFEKFGGFDVFLSKKGLEDWELWINLISNGVKFYYINEPLFKYRVTNYSRTFVEANLNLEEIKDYVYKKHSKFVRKVLMDLYYEHKMLKESPDFLLGNIVLRPYRLLKKLFYTK
ncbi:MAG: glycosyltransferase [Flavobacteriia bacterium]|nr:glycosyltransferase [Flavobacteriia bacterium]